MGLYKLKSSCQNIEDGILERISSESIDYERYFESWLENSPSILFDEGEAKNTVIWIGRQITATIGDTDKFPDLLGLDASGNLVIVELKKGKTPREIIAQIFEYASWGSKLDYNSLENLAQEYYKDDESKSGMTLLQMHQAVFNPDINAPQEITFNQKQRLFLVAEEISPVVYQVSEYLRNSYKVDINHLEYEILKTTDGEYIISVDKTFGYSIQQPILPKQASNNNTIRWNEDIKIRDAVYQTVKEITKDIAGATFTPSDVIQSLALKYPSINASSIRCQIIQDCVNHTSRKYYPSSQHDLFFLVSKGTYRLYNQDKDGKWDWQGKPVS